MLKASTWKLLNGFLKYLTRGDPKSLKWMQGLGGCIGKGHPK